MVCLAAWEHSRWRPSWAPAKSPKFSARSHSLSRKIETGEAKYLEVPLKYLQLSVAFHAMQAWPKTSVFISRTVIYAKPQATWKRIPRAF